MSAAVASVDFAQDDLRWPLFGYQGQLSSESAFFSRTGRKMSELFFFFQGDSGGPLMYLNGNNYELIGVVSFGIGCGQAPAVYAKVRGVATFFWFRRRQFLNRSFDPFRN